MQQGNRAVDVERGEVRQRRIEHWAESPEARAAFLTDLDRRNREGRTATASILAQNNRRLNYLAGGGAACLVLAALNYFLNPLQLDPKTRKDVTISLTIFGFSTLLTSAVMPRDIFGLQTFDQIQSLAYETLLLAHRDAQAREAVAAPAPTLQGAFGETALNSASATSATPQNNTPSASH